MDFFTHLFVGIALGRIFFKNRHLQNIFALGSILPDIDVIVAWLPALFPELYVISHRGLFHTFFFTPFLVPLAILITAKFPELIKTERLLFLSSPFPIVLSKNTWIIGIVGTYLHLLMDTINPQGTVILFPLTNERFSTSTISFFDPIVTIFGAVFFLWIIFRLLYKKQTIELTILDRYSRLLLLFFVITLSFYSTLQINTHLSHPEASTSTIGFLSFQRWILFESDDIYEVQLINQLTQNMERSYVYKKLVWNITMYSDSEFPTLINRLEGIAEYQNFLFRINPDTKLSYNVSIAENFWEITVIDVFANAQNRFAVIEDNIFEQSTLTLLITR